MSEQDPGLSDNRGRDQGLHIMWRAGWNNQSSGSEASPTGPFARISNSEPELGEITRAFREEFDTIGVQPERILGHFVLGFSSEGEETVMELRDESAAIRAFEALRDVHVAWESGML